MSPLPQRTSVSRATARPDGKVGVRNEIWIIPTVGCVNNVATAIEKKAQNLVGGTVEEIVAFPHPYGCSQMGDDQENTRRILADLINHPNRRRRSGSRPWMRKQQHRGFKALYRGL